MERTKFEPFGEEINLAEPAERRTATSRVLTRVGAAAFWTLAVTIVAVRAIYFDPGIYDKFAHAVAFLQGLPKG